MGEPIHLPDGRIVYGKAQAAAMLLQDDEREEIASEPAAPVESQPAESVDFTRAKGINEETKLALYNAGILTWDDVLMTGVVEIADKVAGVGMARARSLFAMAQKEA
ncbi:MAG: hypothetical protein WBO46_27265 [Caldilineaceae bacterium]